MDKKVYLGDGVYASFDGHQIWLSTLRAGAHRPDEIALELVVYTRLLIYAEKVFNHSEIIEVLKDILELPTTGED